MLANYIVRSALLSLVSENITIHEILFASCQSVESQLVLPYMIHKGKGLKKFPHHPERFSVSYNLLLLPLVLHCASLICTTQFSHITVHYPCILPLFYFSLFCLNFLVHRRNQMYSFLCLSLNQRLAEYDKNLYQGQILFISNRSDLWEKGFIER